MVSSEIVRAALSRAQLESSKINSIEEHLSLLNEAYTLVWKNVPDSGEKQFLKEISSAPLSPSARPTEFSVPRPSDYYRTQFIGYRVGGSCDGSSSLEYRINRLNNPEDGQGYDIFNDRWVFRGVFPGSVFIRYWTRPAELTFTVQPRRISDILGIPVQTPSKLAFDAFNNVLVYCNMFYLFNSNQLGKIDPIYDNILNATSTFFYSGQAAVYIVDTATSIVYRVEYSTGSILPVASFSSVYPNYVIDKFIPLFDESFSFKLILKKAGQQDVCLGLAYFSNALEALPLDQFGINVSGDFVFFDSTSKSLFVNGSPVDIGYDIVSAVLSRPFCYIQTADGRVHVQKTDDLLTFGLSNSDYYDPFLVTRVPQHISLVTGAPSLLTGMGLCIYANNDSWLAGALPDTEVRYPNNVFYSAIVYQLAVLMLIKARQDASSLGTVLDNYYKELSKSLEQDAHQAKQILLYEDAGSGY